MSPGRSTDTPCDRYEFTSMKQKERTGNFREISSVRHLKCTILFMRVQEQGSGLRDYEFAWTPVGTMMWWGRRKLMMSLIEPI